MNNPYTILGLPEDAPDSEIESAYQTLKERLAPEKFAGKSETQARLCSRSIESAYKKLKNRANREQYKDELEKAHESAQQTHPRLGQMCVASGIISMDQLQEAVQTQIETGLPLGEVLENKQFLSRAELEGLLLGQDLIDVDGESNDPVAQRLVALNLATVDMVLIAQMEMKWQQVPLADIFVRHGWLEKDIAEALF